MKKASVYKAFRVVEIIRAVSTRYPSRPYWRGDSHTRMRMPFLRDSKALQRTQRSGKGSVLTREIRQGVQRG